VGVLEEALLRLLAVLVHWLADDLEGYKWILQEEIVLVVAVGENEQFEKLQEFELCLGGQGLVQTWEGKFHEFHQNRLDVPILLLAFPFLEEGLEESLEVESHCSEAGALEVEVEVHVVLLRVVGRGFGCSRRFSRDRWLGFLSGLFLGCLLHLSRNLLRGGLCLASDLLVFGLLLPRRYFLRRLGNLLALALHRWLLGRGRLTCVS